MVAAQRHREVGDRRRSHARRRWPVRPAQERSDPELREESASQASKPKRLSPRAGGYRANLVSGVKLGPTGLPIVGGKSWGRKSAPAKYRRLGATRRSDYAYPDAFKYPLVFRTGGRVDYDTSRKHIAAAKGYFTKHKHRYQMAMRQVIARNINKAAKRFGLRADVRA